MNPGYLTLQSVALLEARLTSQKPGLHLLYLPAGAASLLGWHLSICPEHQCAVSHQLLLKRRLEDFFPRQAMKVQQWCTVSASQGYIKHDMGEQIRASSFSHSLQSRRKSKPLEGFTCTLYLRVAVAVPDPFPVQHYRSHISPVHSPLVSSGTQGVSRSGGYLSKNMHLIIFQKARLRKKTNSLTAFGPATTEDYS